MDSDLEDAMRPDIQAFRKNYCPSDEDKQACETDGDEPVDEHRISLPQQPCVQMYVPGPFRTETLRFPDKCANEGYLVLGTDNTIPEEPVKSKPCAAAAQYPPDTSDTDTPDDDDTSDIDIHSNNGSDTGVAVDTRPKSESSASSSSTKTAEYSGDADTGSEASCAVVTLKGHDGELQ